MNKRTFASQSGFPNIHSEETKLPSYRNTSFSKICLGIKTDEQIGFTVSNKKASSSGYTDRWREIPPTSLGRDNCKTLIGSQASLQLNYNKEGLNARIGFLGNNEDYCRNCDSRIGFGTEKPGGEYNTCGNRATHHGDNGNKDIKAMGYILVQCEGNYVLSQERTRIRYI